MEARGDRDVVIRAERTKPATWVPYAGLFLAVAGIIYQGGQLTSRVEQQQDRITRIEAVQASQAAAFNEMNLRGARNEQKLDFLVESQRTRTGR